jgi:acyl-CoA thioesterase-1
MAVLSAGLAMACGSTPKDAPASDASSDSMSGGPPVRRTAGPVVLFLGTSLTAGLGVDPDSAYPAHIQEKIDSAGWNFRVVNAGVSGETSAGGLARLDWLLRQPVSVLVLELGANDGLRGQDVDSLRANLEAIIARTREAHPDVAIVLAGMESPPNMGRAYTSAFRAIFPAVARETHATLIPFLLDSVAAIPELNQADGIHPTAQGQRIVAKTVWKYLEPVLRNRAESKTPGH